MDKVVLVFPHQLYDHHPALSKKRSIFIVEDPLFFQGPKRQIKFHKQKMMLHRATLQAYRDRLSGRGYNVGYIAFNQELLRNLDQKDVSRIYIADPVDCTLERRISDIANKLGTELKILESPGFLNSNQQIRDFLKVTSISPKPDSISQLARASIFSWKWMAGQLAESGAWML